MPHAEPPSNPKRLSAIPRILTTKQLVFNGRNSSTHASRPLREVIPLTPSRHLAPKPLPSKPLIRRDKFQPPSARPFAQPLGSGNRQATYEAPTFVGRKPTRPPPPPPVPSPDPQPTARIDANPEVSVLELIPFGRQPYVIFNKVPLLTTEIKFLSIRNPTQHDQQLFVRSFPKPDKGFNIDATEFLIAPQSEIRITLTWCPLTVTSIRETIALEDIHGRPQKVIINATSVRKESNANVTIRKPRQLFLTKDHKSPTKVVRAPAVSRSSSKRLGQPPLNKQLTKLVFASRRRQSGQIVRSILSKHDEAVAIKIQSYIRMILAKRQLSALKVRASQAKAATVIQSYWRRYKARKNLEESKDAATKVQSYFRMALVRRQVASKIEATTMIQSYMRMILAKRQLAALKIRASQARAATVIQSHWRSYIARNELKQSRNAITKVQSYLRMILVKRQVAMKMKAAILIQSYMRMILAKRQLAALKIRASQARAATVIQSHWRSYIARNELKQSRNAITKVQSYLRAALVKRQVASKIEATILIQSQIRMILAKRQLAALKLIAARAKAATVLQSHWRRYKAQKELEELKAAAANVQSYMRMVLVKRQVVRKIKAVILIQSAWRRHQAMRELQRLKNFRDATVKFQANCRGYLYRFQQIEHHEKVLNIYKRIILRRKCNMI